MNILQRGKWERGSGNENWEIHIMRSFYRGADKFLVRPTSRCILFDGENISFDASLVT